MPSPATLIASLALFVALGGPAEAAKLINGKLIRQGTVRSKQVKDGSLTTRDLSSSAVRSLTATPAQSVGAAQLLPGSISADKIGVGQVGSLQIADESIGGFDIAPNSIDSEEIVNAAVGARKISNNAVDGNELVDGGQTVRDVGAFAGSFDAMVGAIAGQTCTTVETPVAPVREGEDLTNDVVMVTPPAALPDTIVLTAKPLAATTLEVTLCNVSVAGTLDAGSLTFRYVSFAG